ncbi:MAG TPA: hypothetical protein VEA69_03255 [Tepidisphaeraceae bacterium]|nr:hypothetical protein [Tepidisphaeraceae bacterium]
MASDPPTAPPALDYATRPPAGRRALRRALRLWPAWLLLIATGLGIAYGPRAWERYQLLRLQEACMTAELPADRPVLGPDRPPTRPGLAGATPRVTTVKDPRWAALEAWLPLGQPLATRMPTAFLHERLTPSGHRRLVCVEALSGGGEPFTANRYFAVAFSITVIDPAGPLRDARATLGPYAVCFVQVPEGLLPIDTSHEPATVWPGRPDAADPTRFSIPVSWVGVTGRVDFRLEDDESVTLRIADPAAFLDAATAAATAALSAQAPAR